jgi:hypothetical protein
LPDKQLFKSMVESLGGNIGLGEEEDPFVANTKESNQEATDQSVSVGDSKAINNKQPSFDTATHYGG